MLHSQVRVPRYVGTAPATTTFQPNLGATPIEPAGVIPQPIKETPGSPPGNYYPEVPWLTQALWVADPNVDNVKILLPPNQWVTGPIEMRLDVPQGQDTMGPVPTDLELSLTRPYLPVERGWIHTNQGDIFHLQGAMGMSTVEKYAVFASVLSSVALATTAFIAYARYRRER